MRSTIAVISLAALGLLAWVGVARVAPAFEADLRARALAAAGGIGPDLAVEVEGRDVVLSGALPAGVSADQALAVLAALPGAGAIVDRTSPAAPSPERPALPVDAAGRGAVESPDVTPAPEDVPPALEDVPPAPEEITAPEEVAEGDAEDGQDLVEGDFGPTQPAADGGAPEEPALNLAALEVDEAAVAPPPAAAPASQGSGSPAAAPSQPSPAASSGSGALDLAACREALRSMSASRADRIGFAAPDSTELGPEGLAALKRYAAVLVRCPTVAGVVEGFHHNIGNPDRIRALTLKRAEVALAALGRLGVDVARFRPKGLGYLHPRYRNNDAERHLNERVEIKIGVK
jgi:outer membrane protein OmpA-like peptidoglycan-associated protein